MGPSHRSDTAWLLGCSPLHIGRARNGKEEWLRTSNGRLSFQVHELTGGLRKMKSDTLTKRGLQILRKDSGVSTRRGRKTSHSTAWAAEATRSGQVEKMGLWEGCDDWKQLAWESQYYFKRQTSVTVVKDNHSQMLAKADKHF